MYMKYVQKMFYMNLEQNVNELISMDILCACWKNLQLLFCIDKTHLFLFCFVLHCMVMINMIFCNSERNQ